MYSFNISFVRTIFDGVCSICTNIYNNFFRVVINRKNVMRKPLPGTYQLLINKLMRRCFKKRYFAY